MSTDTKPKHIGRNISRLRELRGMKQEALAIAIGVSQQTVSNIENSETVDHEKLQLIANELGVSVEAIKNFSEEGMITYFNNFNDNSVNHGPFSPHQCTFNPLDKLVEVFAEKEALHERYCRQKKTRLRIWKKCWKKSRYS
jgi:transcriptional regulator with XRE-family HTH domain